MDRKRLILSRTIFILRILLCLIFLGYGLVKLLGGQFFHDDRVLDSKTIDGGQLVFWFYGYSPVYGRFLGLCEAVPAMLLLFRRTATLGAAMLFAVSVNITVMDFCYGGMLKYVKYFSLAYTLMLGFLLLCDERRLRQTFWSAELAGNLGKAKSIKSESVGCEISKAERDAEAPSAFDLARMPSSRLGKTLFLAGTSIFILAVAAKLIISVMPSPQAVARDWLVNHGWKAEEMRLVRMRMGPRRMTTLVLEYEVENATPPKIIRMEESRILAWRISKVTEEMAAQ
ncbi:MAG TPA: hypothetical protein VKZ53_14395 [Candidatus Angelobacter sp.]|nr:hypothetical protein [Candidatus Angelobacter sp.]